MSGTSGTSGTSVTTVTTTASNSRLNKLLLVSGVYHVKDEILDLDNEGTSCEVNPYTGSFSKISTKQQGVGGLLLNQYPVYCGGHDNPGYYDGWDYSDISQINADICYMLNKNTKTWDIVTTMIAKRASAAAVVLNENKELFVIAGRGYNGNILNSTEASA